MKIEDKSDYFDKDVIKKPGVGIKVLDPTDQHDEAAKMLGDKQYRDSEDGVGPYTADNYGALSMGESVSDAW